MGEPVAGIRLDYLANIINSILTDDELEGLLGAPLATHIALVVEDGRFQFNVLTPFGEDEKELSEEDKSKAMSIVERIIKSNFPGTEGLPGVR
ncbi:hypothetical protein ACFLRF_01595 [Candidatus Altiarchaeota archaeon]